MLTWFKLTWLSVYMEALGHHEKETILQKYPISIMYNIYRCYPPGAIIISVYEADTLTQTVNISANAVARALDRGTKKYSLKPHSLNCD